jgi:dolichol-phosphate mannosyltransferase
MPLLSFTFKLNMLSMLSLIVPTYNERENIAPLIERLSRTLRNTKIDSEIIIVDDDSPDGTYEEARKHEEDVNLRVIKRMHKRGLSSAILEGFGHSKGDIICVMDADLSHPPEVIPSLLSKTGGHEIVVGSRYCTGGQAGDWQLSRRIMSHLGRIMAIPLTRVSDPVSGFFIVKRHCLNNIPKNPGGFKILLELLSASEKTIEVPYVFSQRKRGCSKMDAKVICDYMIQLARLYVRRIIG